MAPERFALHRRHGRLDPLPSHFDREGAALQRSGIRSWDGLAALDDPQLRRMAAAGDASEARLLRLRAQARLMLEVGLEPADASLLLHAGVASREALAESDAHRLLRQVGRFQRQLAGGSLPGLDLATVRGWIAAARQPSGRSAN
jgi:predicted RecB family nuclease